MDNGRAYCGWCKVRLQPGDAELSDFCFDCYERTDSTVSAYQFVNYVRAVRGLDPLSMPRGRSAR